MQKYGEVVDPLYAIVSSANKRQIQKKLLNIFTRQISQTVFLGTNLNIYL